MKAILIFSMMILFSGVSFAVSYGDGGFFDSPNELWTQGDDNGDDYKTDKPDKTDKTDKPTEKTDFEKNIGKAGEAGVGALLLTTVAGANKNKALGLAGAAFGATLIKIGFASTPATNWNYVAAGVVVTAAALSSIKDSKQNQKVAKMTCAQDVAKCKKDIEEKPSDITSGTNTYNPDNNLGPKNPDDLIQLAKENGITLNPNGDMVTPDKTIPASQLESAVSIAKAFGASPSEAAIFAKDLKKIEVKILKKYGGKKLMIGGGGGNSNSSSANRVIYEEEEEEYGNNNKSRSKKRYVASAKGLSKKFGDSMIGVKGDNIFKIIRRTYKSNQKSLLSH